MKKRWSTDKAKESWEDPPHHDARSWAHLYLSSRGHYYKVTHSLYDDSPSCADWVWKEEAARWLLLNGHELPADLKAAADKVSE